MIPFRKTAYPCIFFLLILSVLTARADSIPDVPRWSPQWRVGAEFSPNYVFGTNKFIRGDNSEEKRINASLSAGVRVDFTFAPNSLNGILYKDVYQGIGIDYHNFFSNKLIGNPVSIFIYQGAPIARFKKGLWLGYEWKFGPAFGWRHYKYTWESQYESGYNLSVSTAVIARMSLGFKLHYMMAPQWEFTAGVEANHFSNGNTSLPNGGINYAGVEIGIRYLLTQPDRTTSIDDWTEIKKHADRRHWVYDILMYGAWRKRVVNLDASDQMCPGTFGVAGLQFSPLYQFNRWVAVGPSLDLKYDESAGLVHYWVPGTWNESIKFYRPPFMKQVSIGLSAHAELIMPIFTLNVGLGVDMLSPKGDSRFYQSLSLKTFVYKNVYINTGYRLGNFSDPQNLMLGLGIRL